MNARRFAALWLFAPLFTGCESIPDINIFTIEDDKDLGAELAKEIEKHPEDYGEILDPAEYPDAYAYLEQIRDQILSSGEVTYANEFDWETHIIDDDEVLNAFAAPGGYIYVYTGLIRYLELEDHFAGVLGHEIAHADQRHSTQQLTKAYGISELLSIILGDSGLIGDVASALVGLEFSREDESEADEYSVIYLCNTEYAADGAAGFFRKLTEEGGVEIPEFLSTHPSSETRVADIEAKADELGCSIDPNPNTDWQGFIDSLPPASGN